MEEDVETILSQYKDTLKQLRAAAWDHICRKKDEITGLSAAISDANKSITEANNSIARTNDKLSKL